MAWSFVAAGTVATGASPTVGLPAGHAANDIFVLVLVSETAPTTSLSGYTLIESISIGSVDIALWWRLATASETAPTVTDTNSDTVAVLLDYRGLTTSPLDAVGAASSTGSTSATNLAYTPVLNCNIPNDALLSIWANPVSGGTWEIVPPAGTTSRVNSAATSSVCGMLIVDEVANRGLSTARGNWESGGGTVSALALSFLQLQPIITAQPTNQYVIPGSGASVTFSVTATASGGSLSYQWYKNGSSIGGATSSTYNYTPVYPTDQGTSFYCAVTDSNATLNSFAASPVFKLPTRFTKRPTQLLPHRYQDFKSTLTLKRWF